MRRARILIMLLCCSLVMNTHPLQGFAQGKYLRYEPLSSGQKETCIPAFGALTRMPRSSLSVMWFWNENKRKKPTATLLILCTQFVLMFSSILIVAAAMLLLCSQAGLLLHPSADSEGHSYLGPDLINVTRKLLLLLRPPRCPGTRKVKICSLSPAGVCLPCWQFGNALTRFQLKDR